MLTCDAGNRCGRYSILVRDGRIVDINPSAQVLTSLYPGAAVVDARDRIVFPGFVNAHHHGESVLLRHITDGTPFGTWGSLGDLARALARLLEPDSAGDVAVLYRTSASLHLRGGTTSVAEFPRPYIPGVLEGAVEELASSGLRAVVALQTWDQFAHYRPVAEPGCRFAISIGPEESLTVYSLDKFVQASAESGYPLAAHLGEQRVEIEALRGRFRKPPLRILKDAGALTPSTHLIHCNHLAEKDCDLARETGVPFSLCLRSTLAKQTGYPLLPYLSARDMLVAVGTDWGSTDMLAELRALRSLNRYLPGMPAFSPLELMRMGTINGAHALGIAPWSGSLEVGKHADLVMIPLEDVRFPPTGATPAPEEIAGIIIDFCDSGMISDVMTRGEFRVRNGELVQADGKEILGEFRRLGGRYLSARKAGGEPPSASRVPLVPADRSADAAPFEHGETETRPPEKQQANLRPPGPPPEETLQKFPLVTKKIKKVFGEDDL